MDRLPTTRDEAEKFLTFNDKSSPKFLKVNRCVELSSVNAISVIGLPNGSCAYFGGNVDCGYQGAITPYIMNFAFTECMKETQ